MGKKQEITRRKQELVTGLAKNRVLITAGKIQLKEKLSVKRQISRVIKRRPKVLFAGSLAVGLVATLLLTRKKAPAKPKASTKGTVLIGWTLSLLKPTAKAWLISRAKAIAANKLAARQPLTRVRNDPPPQ